jgi:hypothetical protein
MPKLLITESFKFPFSVKTENLLLLATALFTALFQLQ